MCNTGTEGGKGRYIPIKFHCRLMTGEMLLMNHLVTVLRGVFWVSLPYILRNNLIEKHSFPHD